MGVKQFSAVYSPIEDRILFGFNTTEDELYQFLITRAISRSLIDQSEIVVESSIGLQHSERSSKLISEFQKEGLKKQINFEEHFDGGSVNPIGADPVLVAGVQLQAEGELAHVSLTLINNLVIGFKVDMAQLQALVLLLEKLANQAGWRITRDEDLSSDAIKSAVATPSNQWH
jgi:hypothetical protein